MRIEAAMACVVHAISKMNLVVVPTNQTHKGMQGWIERLPGCDPFECVSFQEAAGYVLLTVMFGYNYITEMSLSLSARYHTLLDLTEYPLGLAGRASPPLANECMFTGSSARNCLRITKEASGASLQTVQAVVTQG